jgi:hypothetical protein
MSGEGQGGSTPGRALSSEELDVLQASLKWLGVHVLTEQVERGEARLAELQRQGRQLQIDIEAHRVVLRHIGGGFASVTELSDAIAFVLGVDAKALEVMARDVAAGKYRSRP